MKIRIEKKDIVFLLIQLTVWTLILLLPPLTALLSTGDWLSAWIMAKTVFAQLHAAIILYFLNYYLLVPLLFERRRYWLFGLLNVALINGLNLWIFRTPQVAAMMKNEVAIGFYSGIFIYVLLNIAMIAAAIGIRHFLRMQKVKRQLQEERQKNTEAELAWLKNQINPHFLFNTLNNISSLTQIDPDRAQDAIAQLSDLLRYAMYETNKPKVSLQGEVEFMKNYIALMKLRCSERAEVNGQWSIVNGQLGIAPLLFISLIENAFKHGLSNSRPSRIDISLVQDGDTLTFMCDNTNFPKTDADRSGSGIGLENTRRRLELLYPGRYTWQQSLSADNIYHVSITLNVEH